MKVALKTHIQASTNTPPHLNRNTSQVSSQAFVSGEEATSQTKKVAEQRFIKAVSPKAFAVAKKKQDKKEAK